MDASVPVFVGCGLQISSTCTRVLSRLLEVRGDHGRHPLAPHLPDEPEPAGHRRVPPGADLFLDLGVEERARSLERKGVLGRAGQVRLVERLHEALLL